MIYKRAWSVIMLSLFAITQLNALQQTKSRILITNVIRGSTAEKIGLKSGDIILSINGKEIFDERTLHEQLSSSKGSEIKIEILRNGKKMTIESPFNTDKLGIYWVLCERDKILSPKEMREDLDTLFYAISEIHPNPYFNITKEEFDKLKLKTYDKIKNPMSITDFWKVVSPVVASIGDGHTFLWMPDGEWFYLIYFTDENIVFPLKLHIIDNTALVQKNFSDAPIKEGDEILSINGIPTEKIINDFIPYISGELRHFKTAIIEKLFPKLLFLIYGFKGPFNVKIKDSDGKIKEYKLEGGDKNTYEEMKRYDNEDDDFYFKEIPELKTGIIKFNYFTREKEFNEFLKNTFTKIKEKRYKYLIIDLRNNGGGDSQIAEDLLNYITNRPYRFFGGAKIKVSKFTIKYLPDQEFKIDSIYAFEAPVESPPENPLRFNGKIFVLISNYTFSTASEFAAVIKDFKIGTLVGEETGGLPTTYGDPFRVNLPNSHLKLGVSWKYFIRPNGDTTYVHHGVMPDIYVKTTPEDIRKGIDPVMQKIEEIISKN